MHPLSQTMTTSTWLNTSAISQLRMQHKQQEQGQHPQSPPLQLDLAATQSQLPWLDASAVSLAQNPTSATRTRKASSVSPSPTRSCSYSGSTSTWLKQLAWLLISSASKANSPALLTRSVNQVSFHQLPQLHVPFLSSAIFTTFCPCPPQLHLATGSHCSPSLLQL